MIHTICSCSYCCCGCNCGKFFGKFLLSDCWSGAACDCPQSTGVGWDWFDLAGLHDNDGCWGCHCFLTVSMMLMIWLYYSILLLVYEPSKCCNHANLNVILYFSSPSPPPTNKFSNSDMSHPHQLMRSGGLKLAPHCCIGHNIFDRCGSDYNSSNN
jgi:hypothetical protein